MQYFWHEIIKTVFRAAVCFLLFTVVLEWIRPGFVVLHVPLIWILGVVLVSGAMVAICHKK